MEIEAGKCQECGEVFEEDYALRVKTEKYFSFYSKLIFTKE